MPVKSILLIGNCLFVSKKTIPQQFHYLILEVRFQMICLQLSTSLELFYEYFNVEETISLCSTTLKVTKILFNCVLSVAKFSMTNYVFIHPVFYTTSGYGLSLHGQLPLLIHTSLISLMTPSISLAVFRIFSKRPCQKILYGPTSLSSLIRLYR